jgi:hypothetical protein
MDDDGVAGDVPVRNRTEGGGAPPQQENNREVTASNPPVPENNTDTGDATTLQVLRTLQFMYDTILKEN